MDALLGSGNVVVDVKPRVVVMTVDLIRTEEDVVDVVDVDGDYLHNWDEVAENDMIDLKNLAACLYLDVALLSEVMLTQKNDVLDLKIAVADCGNMAMVVCLREQEVVAVQQKVAEDGVGNTVVVPDVSLPVREAVAIESFVVDLIAGSVSFAQRVQS